MLASYRPIASVRFGYKQCGSQFGLEELEVFRYLSKLEVDDIDVDLPERFPISHIRQLLSLRSIVFYIHRSIQMLKFMYDWIHELKTETTVDDVRMIFMKEPRKAYFEFDLKSETSNIVWEGVKTVEICGFFTGDRDGVMKRVRDTINAMKTR